MLSRGIHWTAAALVDEERFPLLGSLLPYADAMFNHRQTVRLARTGPNAAKRSDASGTGLR